jgi:hypothetical protein
VDVGVWAAAAKAWTPKTVAHTMAGIWTAKPRITIDPTPAAADKDSRCQC